MDLIIIYIVWNEDGVEIYDQSLIFPVLISIYLRYITPIWFHVIPSFIVHRDNLHVLWIKLHNWFSTHSRQVFGHNQCHNVTFYCDFLLVKFVIAFTVTKSFIGRIKSYQCSTIDPPLRVFAWYKATKNGDGLICHVLMFESFTAVFISSGKTKKHRTWV